MVPNRLRRAPITSPGIGCALILNGGLLTGAHGAVAVQTLVFPGDN